MSEFRLHMTCCGRDAGLSHAMPWQQADALREGYLSGPGVGPPTEKNSGLGGHARSAIIVHSFWHEHVEVCPDCHAGRVCNAGRALRKAGGFSPELAEWELK